MIERTVYGPIQYLTPDRKPVAFLEVSGLTIPETPATIHVFMDEVAGDNVSELKETANYAGSFFLPGEGLYIDGKKGTARLDITKALAKIQAAGRPVFYVTFLTETDAPSANGKVLRFESLGIVHHTPINTPLDISADVMGGLVEHR